jgi:allophanate hydrolase
MSGVLQVVAAGPQVSWQDAGRAGLMRFGMPLSGPMDRGAFALACRAAGAVTAVEVSRGGVVLDCTAGEVGFAIAGGGFVVERAGLRAGSWQTGVIRTGERMAVRPGHWGSWCYVAFAGEVEVPRWFGAVATHMPSGLGAGMLRAGDAVRVTGGGAVAEGVLRCPVWARRRHVMRVVMGPQERYFPPAVRAAFLDGVYRVTDAGDRMGVRLRGPLIAPEGALGIPSEPILRGSVQVAGDGVPTVLMADHQTTGGYPKIATVIGADLDGFAQLRPRDAVVFRAVTPEAAVGAARVLAAARAAVLAGSRIADEAAGTEGRL